MSEAAAFRVGFVTSALNPKIALFYGSVFATLNRVSSAVVGVFGARLLAETIQEWRRQTA